jgi:hypothetical protein
MGGEDAGLCGKMRDRQGRERQPHSPGTRVARSAPRWLQGNARAGLHRAGSTGGNSVQHRRTASQGRVPRLASATQARPRASSAQAKPAPAVGKSPCGRFNITSRLSKLHAVARGARLVRATAAPRGFAPFGFANGCYVLRPRPVLAHERLRPSCLNSQSVRSCARAHQRSRNGRTPGARSPRAPATPPIWPRCARFTLCVARFATHIGR